MEGLAERKVPPVYPPEARAAGIQGVVVLRISVNKEGIVTETNPISGPRELTTAAEQAVQQWRYRPFILMGDPVNVQTTVRINFKLSR
jgi:protein TonB